MNENPLNQQNLPRIIFAGAAIAIATLALFGLLWLGMGQTGASMTMRLTVAICVPPGILTIVVIGIAIARQP